MVRDDCPTSAGGSTARAINCRLDQAPLVGSDLRRTGVYIGQRRRAGRLSLLFPPANRSLHVRSLGSPEFDQQVVNEAPGTTVFFRGMDEARRSNSLSHERSSRDLLILNCEPDCLFHRESATQLVETFRPVGTDLGNG
jgi:hypothetical protein